VARSRALDRRRYEYEASTRMLYSLIAASLLPIVRSGAEKELVYTPWWPPGTEKTLESVGIVSNGLVVRHY